MQKSSYNIDTSVYRRLIIRLILAIIYTLVFIFIVPRVVQRLLPFVSALLVAVILNPLVKKINGKFSISRRSIALVLDLLIFFSIAFIIFFLVYTLVGQAIAFAMSIQQNWQSILVKIEGFQESFFWLTNILPPQVIDILDGFKENILIFVQNASKNIVSYTVSTTASMTTKTGNFFINFLTFFLAMYFIISDYNLVNEVATKYISKRVMTTFNILKSSVVNALGGYLKVQLMLALFATIYMFVALFIYGQQYAFLIALFLGFIDLLPIVGAIAILMPWGVLEFIGGDMNKGIFIIIVGVSFFLIRKVVEPKIMGSQTGLHPLLALLSTYVGLQFSGVWGAVLGPILLMLALSIAKSGIFNSTMSDLKAVFNRISTVLRMDSL